MSRFTRSLVLVPALVLAVGSLAQADSIVLYNTGLAPAGAIDLNYSLISPEGPAYVMVADGFPIPPYLANTLDSKWIAPVSGTTDNHLPGDYVYRTTFYLNSLIPSTAVITGRWLSDNSGMDIVINGYSTGNQHLALNTSDGSTFLYWSPFVIDSHFVFGENTLDFRVNNFSGTSGNPTALRVEMTGTAAPIPEPTSMLLLGSGLLGLAGAARRRIRR